MIQVKQQLKVPKADPNFFAKKEDILNLDRLEKLSERHPINILITGNQGCGKSSLVRQFANNYNRPMATFQVGLLVESGQLFGQQRLREGETYFQSFLFPQAIQTPRCIIHLEEINRSETPHALNELFSVLSEDRSIWIDELGLVEVVPGVIFFATMNEGEEFTGTDEVDAALMDRFYRLHLEYLPKDVEKEVLTAKTGIDPALADQILNVVNKLRNNEQLDISISIRHSLMIAELMSTGATLREAIIYSLQISMNVLESLLLSVHVETGDANVDLSQYGRYVI
ncbi:MAG: MoxR family ATPase [Spirochaetota bacterium]|nr:MoxR family ATPase [Spirochaetota bacterium]